MQALVTFAILAFVAAVLALPAVLAIVRKHPSWMAITLLTAAVGWTGLGWILALWWALRPAERQRRPARAKASRVKTPRVKTSKAPLVASAPVPRHSGANDNVSRRSDIDDILPDVVASNPYEDWLEHGEALREPDVVEAAPKGDVRLADGLAA